MSAAMDTYPNAAGIFSSRGYIIPQFLLFALHLLFNLIQIKIVFQKYYKTIKIHTNFAYKIRI